MKWCRISWLAPEEMERRRGREGGKMERRRRRSALLPCVSVLIR